MPARKRSRTPARKAAPKPARKAARKPARKPTPRPAPKPPRKAAPKSARKAARKTAARPAPRKSARATKPKRAATPRPRGRGVPTLPIPPAKRRGPAKRRPRRKPAEASPPIVLEESVHSLTAPTPAEIADGEQDPRRYVAVVSEIESGEPFPAQQEAPLFPSRQQRRDVESYPTDIPIAIGAAALVAAVFLPWYKGDGIALSISGWASGTLAPLLAFLGAGSFVLVILRRAGSAVSLPVEESLAHEAVGWIALAAAVVKSRWRPSLAGLDFTPSYGLWLAIGIAAALVILAGRMSPRAPLVVQPGWQRARGGVVGLALLLVIVGGSTAFGVINSPERPTVTSNPDLFKGTVRGKLPDCAKDFPLPTGLKPEVGFDDSGTTCQAQLTSSQTSTDVVAAAKASLNNAKWVFTEVKGAAGSSVFSITKPRCATLAVVPTERGALVALGYTRCPSATPTPTATSP